MNVQIQTFLDGLIGLRTAGHTIDTARKRSAIDAMTWFGERRSIR